MPVPLITCRNSETGATAQIPETALPHMSNWKPIGDEDAVDPSARTQLTDPPAPPPSDEAKGEPGRPADDASAKSARTSTRSKAGDTATKEGK